MRARLYLFIVCLFVPFCCCLFARPDLWKRLASRAAMLTAKEEWMMRGERRRKGMQRGGKGNILNETRFAECPSAFPGLSRDSFPAGSLLPPQLFSKEIPLMLPPSTFSSFLPSNTHTHMLRPPCDDYISPKGGGAVLTTLYWVTLF